MLRSFEDPITGRWARKGQTALLINPDSATCGRGWEIGFEYQFSLMGDHSSMIKFEENDNGNYEKVRDVLRDFV